MYYFSLFIFLIPSMTYRFIRWRILASNSPCKKGNLKKKQKKKNIHILKSYPNIHFILRCSSLSFCDVPHTRNARSHNVCFRFLHLMAHMDIWEADCREEPPPPQVLATGSPTMTSMTEDNFLHGSHLHIYAVHVGI